MLGAKKVEMAQGTLQAAVSHASPTLGQGAGAHVSGRPLASACGIGRRSSAVRGASQESNGVVKWLSIRATSSGACTEGGGERATPADACRGVCCSRIWAQLCTNRTTCTVSAWAWVPERLLPGVRAAGRLLGAGQEGRRAGAGARWQGLGPWAAAEGGRHTQPQFSAGVARSYSRWVQAPVHSSTADAQSRN